MYSIYYIILGLIIPFSLICRSPKNISFLGYKWSTPIIIAVIFVVVARALAYNTGTDYMAYYTNYSDVANGHINEWGENREIGYQYLVKLLTYISNNPQFFFALAGFIYSYSILKIAKLYPKSEFYVLLFWPIFMFVLSYNLYRQYIAISFIYLSVYYLYNKKYKLVITYFILAFLFHTSSIIGIFVILCIWIIKNKPINKWTLISFMFITSFFSSKITGLFAQTVNLVSIYYALYTGKEYTEEGIMDSLYETSILIYLNMFAFSILIWYGDKFCKKAKDFRFLYYIMTLAFILHPITRQEILMRIWLYLYAFVPVFIGILITKHKKINNNPIIWGAIIYLFIYYCYTLHLLGKEHPLIFKI